MSTETAAASGINKQARFRLPLFVNLMDVVAVVVGYLTLSKSLDSINDITTQVRTAILNRTRDAVESTVDGAMRTVKTKAKNIRITKFISLWNASSTWMSAPDIIQYHYRFANVLHLTIYPVSNTITNSQPACQPLKALHAPQIYFQDASTKYVLTGAPLISQAADNSITLSPNTSVIRTDLMPETMVSELATGGIVKGGPFFWSSPLYTPVFKTFLIPLFWPVWPGKALGEAGGAPILSCSRSNLSMISSRPS
ncbi:hypothetical protein HDU97_007537, partial [Phlyctochytrium planicorne]